MKEYFRIWFVFLITFLWATTYWLGSKDVNLWLSLSLEKPWVYRQLVPTLARFVAMYMPADGALCLVVTVFGVLFYLALRKFITQFYGYCPETYVLISYCVGLFIFNFCKTPYDLATAFFFTLSYLYLYTEQYDNYLIIFFLLCLNRETGFLLMWLSLIYTRNWKLVLYQLLICVPIFVGLRLLFANNPGTGIWVLPDENLTTFIQHPLQTVVEVLGFGLVIWLSFRRWNNNPSMLRLAFVTIFPVLFVLYIITGSAFETRIFWEIFPVTIGLVLPNLEII